MNHSIKLRCTNPRANSWFATGNIYESKYVLDGFYEVSDDVGFLRLVRIDGGVGRYTPRTLSPEFYVDFEIVE